MPRERLGDLPKITIRPSSEIDRYLGELARIGIHGKTKAEVAKTLVAHEVERLIKEGILTLRRRRG